MRWGRRKGRTLKTYLETEEIKMLEGATTNLRDRLLVRVLFHLGCRVSEALALSPDDIDFKLGNVIIIHLKQRVKASCSHCGNRLGCTNTFCSRCGEKVESLVKKELDHRTQRIIPVDKVTLKLLRKYIERGGTAVRQGKKLVFGINRHRAWQIIRECSEKAELPKLVNPETGKMHGISPHKLRDAFAVHAVKKDDSGDGLRILQEHLGHTSFNTTARYRKVSGAEHRDWYERLWEEENNG